MKNNALLKLSVLITALSAASCGNDAGKKEAPIPGAVVATFTEPITDDTLNKSTFSLKLLADSVGNGVYDVAVDYGANAAIGKFTMPKGIEDIVPSVRKGKGSYTYIVGFHLPDDTTFYEYYEVTGSRAAIKMRYLNSYSFK